MAIDLEDLPVWAQLQAQRKLKEQERQRVKRTVAPVPLPDRYLETDASRGKYHNKPTKRVLEDGGSLTFDSQKEAARFDDLMLMLQAGKIRNLRLQLQFTLQEAYTTPEGERVRAIRYQSDFAYDLATAPDKSGAVRWVPVVEDVKSPATRTKVYEIKKKLMLDRRNIAITEV